MADDDVVGHKTFHEGLGRFRHEPLTRAEADKILAHVQESNLRRRQEYPDERACIVAINEAITRLEELGWQKAEYAPPDRKIKQTISLWSTGIHDAYCDHTDSPVHLPRKWWWHPSDDGDLWPHSPILYKDKTATQPEPSP